MKNFSECGFKLHIPVIYQIDDTHYEVSFKFMYTQSDNMTAFSGLKWISKINSVVNDYHDLIPAAGMKKITKVVEFQKRPLLREAKMRLEFVQENKNISVLYDISDISHVNLVEVDIDEFDNSDVIEEVIEEATKEENVRKSYEKSRESDSTDSIAEKIANAGNSASDNKYSDFFDYDIPNDWSSNNSDVDRFISATRKEMYYLKNEGGKRHKVTNGKLIRISNGRYAYAFDLEAELYISDDAPITLTTNGIDKISGFVMLCEDFQIILVLNESIGESVSSAYIMVEPWKLLEAMIQRTAYTIMKKDKITNNLVKDGPAKATNERAEYILKGQDKAKEHVRKNPITIIWGPPGTGKTHTMAEIACENLANDKTVLVVSHSNVSVDGVVSKIASLLKQKGHPEQLEKGNVLRYGFIRDEELSKDEDVSSFRFVCKKDPVRSEKLEALLKEYEKEKSIHGLKTTRIMDLNNKIKSIRNEIKDDEVRAVKRAPVVATTVSKLIVDSVFENKKYDLVMFDEVSMAYILQIISAASFAKSRFVCVGDFMQLAPIAQSSAKDILKEDIFSFLGIERGGAIYNHPWLVLLDEQRRMYPDISDFSNRYVYSKLLKDHPCVVENNISTVKAQPFSGNAVNLIDLMGSYCAAGRNEENSRFNILSGVISFASAIDMLGDKKVSIITPYAAQTRLIRALILDLRDRNKSKSSDEVDLKCATVHQFQGSESDVILFDAVESYPGKKPGWLMDRNLADIKRLINVAITRARGKFITVANERFWSDNYEDKPFLHLYYKLLKYIKQNGNVVSHVNDKTLEKYIKSIGIKNMVDFYTEDDYFSSLLKDIDKAKRRIIISLPSGEIEPDARDVLINILEEKKKAGVEILIKSNDYRSLSEKWKEYSWGTENADFPLLEIDENIIWYGAPFADWKFVNKNTTYRAVCKIAIRIKGSHTVEMINSLTSLEYRETGAAKSIMRERDGEEIDEKSDGKEMIGLSKYVKDNLTCPDCGKPMVLSKGKSRKFILWCDDCKKTELLSVQEVNMYIRMNNVVCPKCRRDIKCGLSKYGLYVKCNNGHFSGLDEI